MTDTAARAAEGVPDPAGIPAEPGVSSFNLANALTVGRLALVPVVVVLLFAHGGHQDSWRIAAWGAFAIASITDRFDGEIARRRHSITSFGKLADPIADKALTGASLFGLSVLGDLPWWLTIVILVREVGVTALRFWVIRHGVIAASRGGKLKTLLQGLAIAGYLLPLGAEPWGTVRAVLMGAALAVTLVTGVDYVARALTLRTTSPRAEMKRARRAAVDAARRGTGPAAAVSPESPVSPESQESQEPQESPDSPGFLAPSTATSAATAAASATSAVTSAATTSRGTSAGHGSPTP